MQNNNRPHNRMEEVMQGVGRLPRRIGGMITIFRWGKPKKQLSIGNEQLAISNAKPKEDNIMKKIISLFAVAVAVMLLAYPIILTPDVAHAEETIVLTEDAPTVELLPTVNTIQGNVIWLMKEAAIAQGPAYDLLKLYDIVSLQAQIATINKDGAGTYAGLVATARLTDIVAALGGSPSNTLITFNPGVGLTAGYKTSGKEFDGGIVINVVNLDLSKAAEFLGL